MIAVCFFILRFLRRSASRQTDGLKLNKKNRTVHVCERTLSVGQVTSLLGFNQLVVLLFEVGWLKLADALHLVHLISNFIPFTLEVKP